MIIKTRKGQEIEIDDDDLEKVNKFTWCIAKMTNNISYAQSRYRFVCGNSRQKTVLMHRLIMGALKGQMIDHIDGNGLNNKKSNLRFVDNSRNQMNSKKRVGSSIYKGVYWNKKDKLWEVHVNGKYCGCFKDEIKAAEKYNEIALKQFGEYARINEFRGGSNR